jgi:hypothetical protein
MPIHIFYKLTIGEFAAELNTLLGAQESEDAYGRLRNAKGKV